MQNLWAGQIRCIMGDVQVAYEHNKLKKNIYTNEGDTHAILSLHRQLTLLQFRLVKICWEKIFGN